MILLLDLDGVVQTGHAEGGRWDKHLERDLGIASAALQEQFFKPHWRAIMRGEQDLFEALSACWPELNCKAEPNEFVDYWLAHDCSFDPAVLRAVEEWRNLGRKCMLATNQEHHRARYLWNDCDLARHFDAMHYSAELGVEKPNREFFRRVERRLGSDVVDEIVFFDDVKANVDAASQAGWRAHHYRTVDDLERVTARE